MMRKGEPFMKSDIFTGLEGANEYSINAALQT